MNETLQKKFWDEFIVPFQEKDPTVNFVNPSDLGKALIRARNWAGFIAQDLISLTKHIALEKGTKSVLGRNIRKQELYLLSRTEQEGKKIPSWAFKNKESEKVYILSLITDQTVLDSLISDYGKYELCDVSIAQLEADKESLEIMRKALEKTSDWLIEYLNWHKFDARMTV